jgi:hypothetical protein
MTVLALLTASRVTSTEMPEAGDAETVRRADLDEYGIEDDLFIAEKLRQLREIGGDIVDLALEGRLLHLDGDKEQFDGKAFEKIFVVKVIGEGMGKHLKDHDIVQLVLARPGYG